MGRFTKLETGQDAADAGDGNPVAQAVAGQRAAAPDDDRYDATHYAGNADRAFWTGDYKRALQLYSRVAQMDASRVDAWVGQLLSLIELRQDKEAMIWSKRAIELFPEEPRLVALQGVAYAHTGMLKRGLACNDYALGITGAEPLVWVLRGTILSAGDARTAQFAFDKAMETRHHDDWRTPAMIGLFLLRQRRWSQAAEYLRTAVNVHSANDFLWTKLGEACERLGLTERAIEAFNAAAHLNAANNAAANAQARLASTPLLLRFVRKLFSR